MSADITIAGITIIVPLLNEASNLPRLIAQLREFQAEQTILVDGGSTDGTVEMLARYEQEFQITANRGGRAGQMNHGASLANQEIMLFLHADTRLPADARNEINRAQHWGRFDVRFDDSSFAMQVIAAFMNARSRLTKIATGDQAIFVKRSAIAAIGGYQRIPLMEDIALCKQLKKQYKPYCSRRQVTTSARRWRDHGIIKTVLQMWWYRLAYFCGVSPTSLKRGYKDIR